VVYHFPCKVVSGRGVELRRVRGCRHGGGKSGGEGHSQGLGQTKAKNHCRVVEAQEKQGGSAIHTELKLQSDRTPLHPMVKKTAQR